METSKIVAIVLFVMGALDLILAPIISARMEGSAKTATRLAMTTGAITFVCLGVAFWMGWLGSS